jgi:hypothetical protein
VKAISKVLFALVGSLCLSMMLAQGGHAGTFTVAQSSEIAAVEAQVRAAQFLSRATFGPTQPEIDQLASEIEQVEY